MGKKAKIKAFFIFVIHRPIVKDMTLMSLGAALCFFINIFTTSKTFIVLKSINTNLGIIVNWLQSS